MNTYHPVVEILVKSFGTSPESLEPLHEQMLAYRENTEGLKEALLKHKVTSEAAFQQALASYYELDYRENFDDIAVVREFTEFIPIRYAKKNVFFPLKKDRNNLEVAITNPELSHPLDDLARHFKCHIEPVISHKQAVLDLINRAYDESSASTEEAVDQLDSEETFENILAVEEPEDLLDATDEEPVKRLVNSLLWQAAKDEASDVHIDPTPRDSIVRYRIDGVLQQVTVFPRQVHVTVVNRIKVVSRLDIAQKGLPQDGRSMVLIAGRKIDIRVSTVPTVHGEKIVMRLLYQDEKLMQLRQLGLAKYILNPYQRMVHSSGGIILVTGPTGSGKTTTLYASLAEIDHEARHVITIEEPVEYKLSGYSQIEVKPKLGLTFANALRSALRQDPDVIMVGEMRDTETAQIAIQSALTGHLVFSTVHTNSAPATITRLIDMGIEPFLVSSTIVGVLAQRLVRRICPDCRKSYQPHPEQLRELGITEKNFSKIKRSFYRGEGCDKCRQTGYRGRIGIHELLKITEGLKNTILKSSDSTTIKKQGLKEKMITLRRDGVNKILHGLTTVEEILSITSE
ncbi:MAG: Flp pilus assembly complex ATPase component TadA [SAR324 cluster bacterium]|uniref:Bacterial type II secretion system protein E domain-containing protein n=1 Tax=marine metagenome TaxID=408172 RepID=A0A381TJN9_9ZZZZ|nr:Flp pilus assembly complex ATPase component TadA [SAR324 cluster bacterium]|tara:strand:- start:542 stop:2254 length:1713 start_codon:yes stop_codon:yes gene_type:complete